MEGAYLTPEQVAGRPLEALLRELEPLAAARAVAPISNFHVGAVAVGASGAVYLGFNLEFVLVRSAPAAAGTTISANCELSDNRTLDCPNL